MNIGAASDLAKNSVTVKRGGACIQQQSDEVISNQISTAIALKEYWWRQFHKMCGIYIEP